MTGGLFEGLLGADWEADLGVMWRGTAQDETYPQRREPLKH